MYHTADQWFDPEKSKTHTRLAYQVQYMYWYMAKNDLPGAVSNARIMLVFTRGQWTTTAVQEMNTSTAIQGILVEN